MYVRHYATWHLMAGRRTAEALFPCGRQILEGGQQLGGVPRLNRAVHVLIGDAELNSIASTPRLALHASTAHEWTQAQNGVQ